MVEMLETASILRHATNRYRQSHSSLVERPPLFRIRSLVILDELGRGSSTSDGSAIAFAVVQVRLLHFIINIISIIINAAATTTSTTTDLCNESHFPQKLLNHSNCAALISTHFHNLVAEIPPSLATPMHMSAIVDEASASVTFLYKLVHGCRFVVVLQMILVSRLLCTQRPVIWAPLRCCCRTPPVCYFRLVLFAYSQLHAIETDA